MGFNYDTGDVVIIRSDYDHSWDRRYAFNSNTEYGMYPYLGKEATIVRKYYSELKGPAYYLSVDNEEFFWCEDLLLPGNAWDADVSESDLIKIINN